MNGHPNPQLLIHVHDHDLGLLGYLAVDSFIGGKAYGGIRVKISDNARDEAHPVEAAHLAREMSLKFGFHEIPLGGAKSVIVLPPGLNQEQRDRYFKAFGKQLSPLLQRNLVQAGLDMGMTARDLHVFGQGTGLIPADAEPPDGGEGNDSGRFTAIGLAETFRVVRDFYSLADSSLTCALEGFGSVGSYLAQYLAEMNVRVAAISTLAGGLSRPDGLDVRRLIALRQEHGDNLVHHYADAQKIKKEELYTQKADILFLCGGLFPIHSGNVNRLQCKFIIAGANCAMDDECAQILYQRGTVYIPGFVANAGAVLRNHLAKTKSIAGARNMEDRIRGLFPCRVKAVLEAARGNGMSLYKQAVRTAHENVARMEEEDASCRPSLVRKIISLTMRR